MTGNLFDQGGSHQVRGPSMVPKSYCWPLRASKTQMKTSRDQMPWTWWPARWWLGMSPWWWKVDDAPSSHDKVMVRWFKETLAHRHPLHSTPLHSTHSPLGVHNDHSMSQRVGHRWDSQRSPAGGLSRGWILWLDHQQSLISEAFTMSEILECLSNFWRTKINKVKNKIKQNKTK